MCGFTQLRRHFGHRILTCLPWNDTNMGLRHQMASVTSFTDNDQRVFPYLLYWWFYEVRCVVLRSYAVILGTES